MLHSLSHKHRSHMLSLKVVSLLGYAFVVPLANLHSSASATPQDCIVDSNEIWDGADHTCLGELIITSSGTLTITNNVTVKMQPRPPLYNPPLILVEGTLNLSGTATQSPTITCTNTAIPIRFRVSGSLNSSSPGPSNVIEYVGLDYGAEPFNRSGIQFALASTGNIADTTIRNSEAHALTIIGAADVTLQNINLQQNGGYIGTGIGIFIAGPLADAHFVGPVEVYNFATGVYVEASDLAIKDLTIGYSALAFDLNDGSDVEVLDTIFDESAVAIDATSALTVKWTLGVEVLDCDADMAPLHAAPVSVFDLSGEQVASGATVDGYCAFPAVEYVRTFGDTTYHTPHRVEVDAPAGMDPQDVTRHDGSHVRVDGSPQSMTFMVKQLQLGMNCVSIPFGLFEDQSVDIDDSRIREVLSSLSDEAGEYPWDVSVYVYDATDQGDPWKQWASYKPEYMNDLQYLDTGLGEWPQENDARIMGTELNAIDTADVFIIGGQVMDSTVRESDGCEAGLVQLRRRPCSPLRGGFRLTEAICAPVEDDSGV